MKTIAELEQRIVEDFELFDEWEEKYQYIIELGQKLKPYATLTTFNFIVVNFISCS